MRLIARSVLGCDEKYYSMVPFERGVLSAHFGIKTLDVSPDPTSIGLHF